MLRIILLLIAAVIFIVGFIIACDGGIVIANAMTPGSVSTTTFMNGVEIIAVGVIVVLFSIGIAWVGKQTGE